MQCLLPSTDVQLTCIIDASFKTHLPSQLVSKAYIKRKKTIEKQEASSSMLWSLFLITITWTYFF